MKKVSRLILYLSILFCVKNAKSQTQLTDSLFHPDTLKYWVNLFASDSMMGRFTGSSQTRKAARIIASEFNRAGLLQIPGANGYYMEIEPTWANVLGTIDGKSKRRQVIIISAHYDHIGTIYNSPGYGSAKVERGDTIYNGANDNASGLVAMLRLMHYFKKIGNNERTIMFAAFCGEEQGMIGSRVLASSIKTDSVVAMINIEMIGRKDPNSENPFITGNDFPGFRNILNANLHKVDKIRFGSNYFHSDRFLMSMFFARSDNYPFALKGVPAHSIMATTDYDEYYHNLNDEPSTLDYEFMSKVITAIALSATSLLDGTDTPTRIRVR